MWKILRSFIITSANFHLLDPSYWKTQQFKNRIWRAHKKAKIPHLLYLEVLKLIAKPEEEIQKQIK